MDTQKPDTLHDQMTAAMDELRTARVAMTEDKQRPDRLAMVDFYTDWFEMCFRLVAEYAPLGARTRLQ